VTTKYQASSELDMREGGAVTPAIVADATSGIAASSSAATPSASTGRD